MFDGMQLVCIRILINNKSVCCSGGFIVLLKKKKLNTIQKPLLLYINMVFVDKQRIVK